MSKLSLSGKNNVFRALAAGWLVLAALPGFTQDKSPAKFGQVNAADFANPLTGADTGADAVVISDIGVKTFDQKSALEFGWNGYLERTKRILILKRRGFEEATITIPLQVYQMESDEITGLKGATYNLENGKVVKTELDKNSTFKIKVSENWVAQRFTFPAVREGSIIEYTYRHSSPFVLGNISWQLQSIYPCLWSEYKVTIPSAFSFSVAKHSVLPLCIETSESYEGIHGNEHTYHWAVKYAPALREEPFTTTVNNYLARVDVRVSGFQARTSTVMRSVVTNAFETNTRVLRVGGVLVTWNQLDRQLLKSDHFGADLGDRNSWLDKDMKQVTAGAEDDLTKVRKIYDYVRDNFACTSRTGYLMAGTLKSVYKARSGNVAELNLLLTAMLLHEKLNAFPVLLSTRSNGFINEIMPQASRLNYVICKLEFGARSIYLDASDRNLGCGQLPLECYNGYDVVVDTTIDVIENGLSADSLTEQKKVVVFLSNGDKPGLDGSVQYNPGKAEAAEVRKKMKEQDGEKNFTLQLGKGAVGEVTFSDLEIDSLAMPDEPLVINYSCHLGTDVATEKLYFTPTIVDRITENPFKEAMRVYPVEMPYARDANYILTMDIPSGYLVEELPKSEKITLEDGSYFEYLLSQDGDQVHFRTRLRLMKANYEPQEYELLRSFFATVVNKENEQIVFKRKK
jgi:hypothetical protein